MLILRRHELALIELEALRSEVQSFKELLKAKNDLVVKQQNEIYDLKRDNRILTAKIDNMTDRFAGSVISYV